VRSKSISYALAIILFASNASSAASEHKSGELLLIVEDGFSVTANVGGQVRSSHPRVDALLQVHQLEYVRDLNPGVVGRNAGSHRFLKLHSSLEAFDPLVAASQLMSTGAFVAVAPNYRADLFVSLLPSDPYLSVQYHVDDPINDADVELAAAWQTEQGSPSTIIGILDSGTDLSHPDLVSQAWVNAGEIAGNGVDDDGNGYIDDINGWDFGDDDSDPLPQQLIDWTIGVDVGWHGTHVGGIAAATANNGIGIAGAAYNCSVMSLKVSNTAGEIWTDAIAEAMMYSGAMGVSVLNVSLGVAEGEGISGFFHALVDDVMAANVVCVAAAGNSGLEAASYPAASIGCISVGGTDNTNARAPFSSYGSTVDVAAPGASIFSTIATNYVYDEIDELLFAMFFLYDGVNPYMYSDGTSMASPVVAGTAALVRSRFPAMTPAEVRQHLIDTGDVVAFDQPVGVKLNAEQAVQGPTSSPPSVSLGLHGFDASPNPFNPSVTISFSMGAPGWVELAIYNLRGERVRVLMNEARGEGFHESMWNGRDEAGRTVSSGVYLARVESLGASETQKLVLVR
jgi:subtilisin family serine protease